MGIGVSIFLITLGAILRFAIKTHLVGQSVDIHTIGVILMIVGGASALLQIAMVARSRPPTNSGNLYNGDHQPPSA